MATKKIKVSGYVDQGVWSLFLNHVFHEYGKTSGGAISKSLQTALQSYVKKADR